MKRQTAYVTLAYLMGVVLLSSIDVVYEWFSPLVSETGESIDWCLGIGLRAGAFVVLNHEGGFAGGLLTDVHRPQFLLPPFYAGAGPGSGGVAVGVWLPAVVAWMIHLLLLRHRARRLQGIPVSR